MGFPKSVRLLKHADFDRVYRQGKRHFSRSMTFFYLRRDAVETSGPRVGFTVGRVLGGAVDRNRMRRRLREAVRRNLPGLSAGVDVVINPKKSVSTVDFPGLMDEVERAFHVIETSSPGAKSRLEASRERGSQ